MKSLAFQQVDVFTFVPFKGNLVALVLDGNDLSGETSADRKSDYALKLPSVRGQL
jgi:predicted PhzF superfamily epimerase YddE/YHI9